MTIDRAIGLLLLLLVYILALVSFALLNEDGGVTFRCNTFIRRHLSPLFFGVLATSNQIQFFFIQDNALFVCHNYILLSSHRLCRQTPHSLGIKAPLYHHHFTLPAAPCQQFSLYLARFFGHFRRFFGLLPVAPDPSAGGLSSLLVFIYTRRAGYPRCQIKFFTPSPPHAHPSAGTEY